MKRIRFAAAALVLSTSALIAQTAKQQAGIDDDKKTIAEYAKSMNITCGSHIVVSTDYASYKAVGGVDEDHNAPWHDCRNAIDTVDLTCRNSDAQKAGVQKGIEKIQCGYSATEQMDLKNKVLHYTSPIGAGNPTHVKDYLDKTL